MSSGGMVKFGGVLGLVGAVALMVLGVLTLADRVLGTLGEIVLWLALAMVAVGAVTLFLGLLQGDAVAEAELSES
jgi:hypothetical protein